MYSLVIKLLPFVFLPGASGTNSLPRPGPLTFDADEDCRATAAKVFNPWNGMSRVKGSDARSGSVPGASSAGEVPVLPVGDAAFASGMSSAGRSPVRDVAFAPGMLLTGGPGAGDSSTSCKLEPVGGTEVRAKLAGDAGTRLAGDALLVGDAGTGLARDALPVGDTGVGAGLVEAASLARPCGLLVPGLGGVAWAEDAGAGVIAILFCLDVLIVRELVK